MAKGSYSIPASTKKNSPKSLLPNTLVRGSNWSKTAGTTLGGGSLIKGGDVGKIHVPACSPSPPAKKG